MTDQNPGPPWAVIAHRGGHWAGVAASIQTGAAAGGNGGRGDDVASFAGFVAEFLADGCTVHPVYSRDEYLAFMATLKPPRREADRSRQVIGIALK